MRSIALLALMSILGVSPVVVAQDDTTDAGAEQVEEQAPTSSGQSGFAPSEEVEADTAVAFPTDI